jgi:hypothetical protein
VYKSRLKDSNPPREQSWLRFTVISNATLETFVLELDFLESFSLATKDRDRDRDDCTGIPFLSTPAFDGDWKNRGLSSAAEFSG